MGVTRAIRKLLGRAYRPLICPTLRFLATPFFEPEYLKGRYFEESLAGWQWVWRSIWLQKLGGFNRQIPWPVSPFIRISNADNISFHPDDINNFQTFGCYFQNYAGRITIGRGTWIAPNVGIITANHDPEDPARTLPGEDVVIGDACWIGMNAVILPGVTLGPHTVVGAGSVVTKSFSEGHCLVAGVPARRIKSYESAEASAAGPEDLG